MSEELSAERWARIEALFQGASELEGEERELWLDAECAGDAGLREEVVDRAIQPDQLVPEGLAFLIPLTRILDPSFECLDLVPISLVVISGTLLYL